MSMKIKGFNFKPQSFAVVVMQHCYRHSWLIQFPLLPKVFEQWLHTRTCVRYRRYCNSVWVIWFLQLCTIYHCHLCSTDVEMLHREVKSPEATEPASCRVGAETQEPDSGTPAHALLLLASQDHWVGTTLWWGTHSQPEVGCDCGRSNMHKVGYQGMDGPPSPPKFSERFIFINMTTYAGGGKISPANQIHLPPIFVWSIS